MEKYRKGDKRPSAPPDFLQPDLKDYPKFNFKVREETKSTKTYGLEKISQVQEDLESYVKPLSIVKIWRRKMRSLLVYKIDQILAVGDQDESWIQPYEIVKIQRRKTQEELSIDEVEYD
jgi:hypothetical protein